MKARVVANAMTGGRGFAHGAEEHITRQSVEGPGVRQADVSEISRFFVD